MKPLPTDGSRCRTSRVASALLTTALLSGLVAFSGCSKPALPPTLQQRLALLSEQAEAGKADAQFELGRRLNEGDQLPMDVLKAVEWLTKAASQGHTQAQLQLVRLYLNGDGVPMDGDAAARWFTMAAASSDMVALATVQSLQQAISDFQEGTRLLSSKGIPGSDQRGLELINKAANQGLTVAQMHLGISLLKGDKGIPKDVTKGFEWLTKAADQGDSAARYFLGTSLLSGLKIPRDRAKGRRVLLAAAARGHTDSQVSLATDYCSSLEAVFEGEHVAKLGGESPCDPVLAYAWASVAALKGDQKAANLRDEAAGFLKPAAVAEGKALAANWKPGVVLIRRGRGGGQRGGPVGMTGTGTGFYVTTEGHVVTNDHVVDGCTEVRFQGSGMKVEVVTADKVNDLALLKASSTVSDVALLSPSQGGLRQGEEIVVYGFPLNSVLSSGGNLSPGIVSALSGMGNNTSQIQITAPIQPGSSGSAVLDRKGHLVGVVASTLTGKGGRDEAPVPQNVNFAVNGQTLRAFLDGSRVSYEVGSRFFDWNKSTEKLGEAARKWTVLVECWE